MPQNTVHVGARIPEDLYNTCSTKYKNMTAAIIAGLELLVEQDENNRSTEENNCLTNENIRSTEENMCSTEENNCGKLKAVIEEKNRMIQELRESLAKSPDPVELAEVRAHSEGLKLLLEERNKRIDEIKNEKDARIQELTREINRIDYHSMKNSETKQIEAPGIKRWWEFWK